MTTKVERALGDGVARLTAIGSQDAPVRTFVSLQANCLRKIQQVLIFIDLRCASAHENSWLNKRLNLGPSVITVILAIHH